MIRLSFRGSGKINKLKKALKPIISIIFGNLQPQFKSTFSKLKILFLATDFTDFRRLKIL